MDAGRAEEKVAGMRFAADLRRQFEALAAAESAAPRPRTLRKPRFLALAAALAAAAIFVFAVLPLLRGPETATAADMLASMDAAVTRATVVRLSITERLVARGASASPSSDGRASETPREPFDEQLTLSATGDVRYEASATHEIPGQGSLTSREVLTYDARRHEQRRLDTVVPDDGASVLVIERPSWGSSIFEVYSFENFTALAASLRAQLAESDPDSPVSTTTYLERPAWRTVLEERLPGDRDDPDGRLVTWTVTVDKATGLLVASDLELPSDTERAVAVTRSFRVTRLEVDPQLPKGWQSIPVAGQKRIAIEDVGTRFGSPESLARRSSPTPVLVPEWIPAGYRLADAATTDYEGMKASPKDKSRLIYLSRHDPRMYLREMTSIDASAQRVVLRYRRGFSTFTVEVKPLQGGTRGIGSSEASQLSAEEARLTAGYLKGELAVTSISPWLGQGPTLVTDKGGYRITVTGDLTRRGLIAVADSLRAVGD